MNSIEILQSLVPVVDALERLHVFYHIGGSVASSLYGQPRSTQDVDIVADLHLSHVRPFVTLLEHDYYVVEDAVRDAIQRHSSFNLISNETLLKVDVFIPKTRPFDQDAFHHVRQKAIQQGGRVFSIASPENTIVNKLEWYKMGGGVSDRQWGDILNVLRGQGTHLDFVYLNHWARVLQVADLLKKALVEVGLQQP